MQPWLIRSVVSKNASGKSSKHVLSQLITISTTIYDGFHRELTSASSNAIEVARAKADNEMLLLKTRLESLEMALEKAERREDRTFATHKELQEMHHRQVTDVRKELGAEVETLKEQKKQLAVTLSSSESEVKISTAEVTELKQKLEIKIAECEDIRSRLVETDAIRDAAVLKCKSLETALAKAETEKETAEKESLATKVTLDEARASHSKSMANLEVSLISAVRASFRPDNVSCLLNNDE